MKECEILKHSALEKRVEKRVAGIIRWLERMKKSYRDGAIECALMDAECARADLETLRNDVWQKVKPVKHEHKNFLAFIRAFSLSVIVILFSVSPIARDIVPVQSVKEEMNSLIEPRPIIVIREDEKHEVRTAAKTSTTITASSKRQSRRQTAQKKSEKPAVNTRTVTSNQTAQKTVPYDKVFSLVQTGQRALKENNSVINIKK